MRILRITLARATFLISLWALPLAAQESQGPPEAQGFLLEARTEVTLPSPGSAVSVKTVFKLQPGHSAWEIPLSLLSPEPTQLGLIRAFIDGQELDVTLAPGAQSETEGGEQGLSSSGPPRIFLEKVRDHYWEGVVALGERAEAGRDSLSLEIFFSVEEAWSEAGAATLPLVVPRWVPDSPTPRTFLAEVSVPDGYTVTGSFPTSVLARPEPGSAGLYEIGLQGVPAMLILRTTLGRGTFLTLERGLDLFVVLILLAIGIAGLRYLRRRGA